MFEPFDTLKSEEEVDIIYGHGSKSNENDMAT